jgi:hypothetical protein
VVRYLLPHALIVLGVLDLWFWGGLPDAVSLTLLLGGHLLVPIWAAAIAPREQRVRAALLGPIALIAVEALVIVLLWIVYLGGIPEDAWLNFYLLMIWAAALAIYTVYCAIVFPLVARTRR